MLILQILYILTTLVLAVYGLNAFVLSFLYGRTRHQKRIVPALTHFPAVTVQLPIYNELYVVERLIDAAAGLDWARDKLEIEVLDDSDDETTRLAHARAEFHRKRGVNIRVLRRPDRTGFKAGALRHAFGRAQGEFIAVFDADFVPPADFLKRTIPFLVADKRLGAVQTRWGHLNAEYAPLTRAQALALDSHFAVEQSARARNDLFLNFNGSAGVWRRECIQASGGWQEDTLSEDLDLSYRAQLEGWHIEFRPEVVCPAEIPPQLQAFKRQQARWAEGSTQVLMKLGLRVLRARASLFKRVQAVIHLAGYLVQSLFLVYLLTLVPLIAARYAFPALMTVLVGASFGPPLLYALAQRELYSDWGTRFRYFPLLLLLGIGLSFNNSIAVGRALLHRPNTFRRTPKFSVEQNGDDWNEKKYALPFSWTVLGELALALYSVCGVVLARQDGQWWAVGCLSIYALAFGLTAGLTLWQSRSTTRSVWESVSVRAGE